MIGDIGTPFENRVNLYIGSSVKSLRDAKAWLLVPGVEDSLNHLVTWAASKEQEWGHCVLFFEVSCYRRPGEKGQIDLLIAFGDRIAICEVKNGLMPERLRLKEAADQVTRQAELVRTRLDDRRWLPGQRPAPLLFFPRLNEGQLSEVHRMLNNEGAPQVRPAGCLPHPSAHRLSLVESVEGWLKHPQFDVGKQRSLSELVREKLVSSRFEPVPTLDRLLRFVRDFRAPSQLLRQPIWHIRSLRADALHSAADHLRDTRFLEISGPKGIGKTALIRDLMTEADLAKPFEIPLKGLPTVDQIARTLYSSVLGAPAEDAHLVGEHSMLAELLQEDATIWVSSYDAESRVSLRDFLHTAVESSAQVPNVGRFCILIESGFPLEVYGLASVRLEPFTDIEVVAIIAGVPARQNINTDDIVRQVAGNPGMAVALKQGDKSYARVLFQQLYPPGTAPWHVRAEKAANDLTAAIRRNADGEHEDAIILAAEAAAEILWAVIIAGKGVTASRPQDDDLRSLVSEIQFGIEKADQDGRQANDRYLFDAAERLDQAIGELLKANEGHEDNTDATQVSAPLVQCAVTIFNWSVNWLQEHDRAARYESRVRCEVCGEREWPIRCCSNCFKWVGGKCVVLNGLGSRSEWRWDAFCKKCDEELPTDKWKAVEG